MNVLFIGNSYTFYNHLPKLLEALAEENGKEISVASVTKGGRKLYRNLDPEDEHGKEIRHIAEKGNTDALFLQEQSYYALVDYEKFLEGVSGLIELVGAKRNILYATWGRKIGASLLDELKLTSEEMTDALDEKYANAASACGAEVSHVGKYFASIAKAYPLLELYDPDLSHPSYLGSCAAAIMHYKTLFGELPKKYESLNCSDAEMLLRVAAETEK